MTSCIVCKMNRPRRGNTCESCRKYRQRTGNWPTDDVLDARYIARYHPSEVAFANEDIDAVIEELIDTRSDRAREALRAKDSWVD